MGHYVNVRCVALDVEVMPEIEIILRLHAALIPGSKLLPGFMRRLFDVSALSLLL
jgi:hypothetical protein